MINDETIKELYNDENIQDFEALQELIAYSSNPYLGIAVWYKNLKAKLCGRAFLLSLDERKMSVVIENIIMIDGISVQYLILILNFLCTDDWWSRLPSAYNLMKLRKKDKDGLTLFDKASSAFERTNIRLINETGKNINETAIRNRRFGL